MKDVYLQLYSLFGDIDKDFVGALERTAKAGYTGVEFAMSNYGDMPVEELAAHLKRLNLVPYSTHIRLWELPETIEIAKKLGMPYIIIAGAYCYDLESARQVARELNEACELCRQNGIQLGYHNHRGEFSKAENGQHLLDIMIENTDPEKVFFQMDVGWTVTAGIDWEAYMNKYSGRFRLIHDKETTTDALGPSKMHDPKEGFKNADGKVEDKTVAVLKMRAERTWNTALGQGMVDWKRVKAVADAQGAKGYIDEREHDYCGDIFKCIEEDAKFLHQL